MRLLTDKELRREKGVPYSRRHLLTLEKEGRFPRRIGIGAYVRWSEDEIDAWIAERAAERDGRAA